MATYRLNHRELQETIAKVATINARAVKRGFTGRLEVVSTRIEVKTKDIYGMRRVEALYDTEITGEPPKYGSWVFLATLDWHTADDLIVRTAPGVEAIDHDGLRKGWCDHCRTQRARRNTYLVRDEAGTRLQVGSTCIKDFLGWSTGVVFINRDDVVREMGFGSYPSSPDMFATVYVLAVAWALVKLDGYKPASSHGSTTKGDVLDVLLPPRNMPADRRAELARIRDLAHEATDRAQECLAWILSDDFTGDSEYVRNLKTLAASEYIGTNGVGLLASAPQAWARWQNATLIKETEKKPSAWIGSKGERIQFTATLRSVSYVDSDWGSTALYTLVTPEGNIVKWFSTNHGLGDKPGVEFTLKATVKKHELYKDIQQTLVTRAKKIEASK